MQVNIGDEIPQWEMASVSPERMRTMAAILRDPNPLHWDRDVVNDSLGIGRRTINQGPLGLSYIINMIHSWSGENSIRRIVMGFPMPLVLDGDCVTAKGVVKAVTQEEQGQVAECNVWLEKDGLRLLDGTVFIILPG